MNLSQTLLTRNLDLPLVKKSLSTSKAILDGLSGTSDSSCHSSYYKTASMYHKAAGPPEAYYKNALMYISYTKVEDMSPADRSQLALDVSLAALTGEGVYNFGEVVTTPILECLKGTDKGWVMELMVAFSEGNVNSYNDIVSGNKGEIEVLEGLFERMEFVNEKIKLLALVNMVFERASSDR